MNDRKEPGTIKVFSAVLFLLLIIITEYTVIDIVNGYGNNDAITSYVSFAGTIISIILAVLAIVYSYYQSFAIQSDSSNLSNQIGSLNAAISLIKNSTVGLSDNLNRITEISTKLDHSIKTGEDLAKASIVVHDDILELRSKIESSIKASTKEVPPSDVKPMSLKLANLAEMHQRAVYVTIAHACKNRQDIMSAFEKYIKPVLESGIYKDRVDYYQGFYVACTYILLDMDMLSVRDADEPWIVTDAFAEAIDEMVTQGPNEDTAAHFDVASVRRLMATTVAT